MELETSFNVLAGVPTTVFVSGPSLKSVALKTLGLVEDLPSAFQVDGDVVGQKTVARDAASSAALVAPVLGTDLQYSVVPGVLVDGFGVVSGLVVSDAAPRSYAVFVEAVAEQIFGEFASFVYFGVR